MGHDEIKGGVFDNRAKIFRELSVDRWPLDYLVKKTHCCR